MDRLIRGQGPLKTCARNDCAAKTVAPKWGRQKLPEGKLRSPSPPSGAIPSWTDREGCVDNPETEDGRGSESHSLDLRRGQGREEGLRTPELRHKQGPASSMHTSPSPRKPSRPLTKAEARTGPPIQQEIKGFLSWWLQPK